MMSRAGLIIIFAAGALAMAALTWPAASLVEGMGASGPLAFTRMQGTVWHAAFEARAVDGHAYEGTASMRPLSLLALAPQADWSLSGSGVTANGRAGWRGGGLSLSRIAAALPLAARIGTETIRGRLLLSLDRLDIADGACTGVQGRAVLEDMALPGAAALAAALPEMRGGLSCEAGMLVADLAGASDAGEVRAIIRASLARPSGAAITLRTGNAALREYLRSLGFPGGDSGFRLTSTSRVQNAEIPE